jgi:transglutaminase-like putative cysteine protease
VALCRYMNIPARYCTGYLGDIGMPPPYSAVTTLPDESGSFSGHV